MSTQKTLTRFIVEQQHSLQDETGDLSQLLSDIATACKQISHSVNRGAINGMLGISDSTNVQGETQKQLDIIAHDIMVDALSWNGQLAGMVSEEIEELIGIPEPAPRGQYLLLFDPLDGSSNIDINLTVGTIFSILKTEDNHNITNESFLQQGVEQVCAGFVLYGPATILILTTGHGVNGFTLDQDIGEFVLTHPNMTIPEDTQEFAINLSNQRFWEPAVQRYIDECLQGAAGPRGQDFNMRWVASMVAEVYRVLTRGGIFMYPIDQRMQNGAGKLRLMYEVNPMGFIVEQAGGACSTGYQRTMTLAPEDIHQRVPVILGSRNEVERVVAYHQ